MEEIQKKIDKNREEINKILSSDLPPNMMHDIISFIAAKNERLMLQLKKETGASPAPRF